MDAALEALRAARAEGAGATFAAAIAGERLARRSGPGADPEGADKRARAYAEALEVQAGLIDEALTSRGLGHYEISNYARPGCEARHNLTYWRGQSYLGIGAGAHSYAAEGAAGRRWWNERLPATYIGKARRDGNAEAGSETPDAALSASEFAFLNLRLTDGLELRRSIEKPSRYRLFIAWDTVDDHNVGFRGSPDFQEWRKLVGHCFASPPEVEHVQQVLRAF